MVAKSDVLTAKHRIEEALEAFVRDRAEAKVLVFVNEWGHLHAVVASYGFERVPEGEREDQVWDYLRSHVPAEDLVHLYRIHAMTCSEYDARLSRSALPGGYSEILRLDERDEGTGAETDD